MSAARLAGRLATLLDQQRACLVQGDLGGALRLAPALDGLLAGLDRTGRQMADAPALRVVQEKARRNAALISAARAGMADAQRAIRGAGRTDFAGYDAQGRMAPIDAGRPTLERRS